MFYGILGPILWKGEKEATDVPLCGRIKPWRSRGLPGRAQDASKTASYVCRLFSIYCPNTVGAQRGVQVRA